MRVPAPPTTTNSLALVLLALVTVVSVYNNLVLSGWYLLSPPSPSAILLDPLAAEVVDADEGIDFTSFDGVIDDDDVYAELDLCEDTAFERNPNPTDAEGCATKPYGFLPASFPPQRILLASFPGSGNTWARHLLERGLGILTGSVYNDELIFEDFPGERCSNATRVSLMKTHEPWCSQFNRLAATRQSRSYAIEYDATVLLLRNPKSALLSMFNFVYSNYNHTGHVPSSMLSGLRFEYFIQLLAPCWSYHSDYYLASEDGGGGGVWRDKLNKPVLLVYYEDLKRDAEREMLRVFAFLREQHGRELVPSVAQATRCALRGSAQAKQGSFHREKRAAAADASGEDFWHKKMSRAALGAHTLHELVCSFAANKTYYRKDDAEWCRV